ncbi:MAG: hypothetical protein AAB875_01905 [Patescibacteria group bacterium]
MNAWGESFKDWGSSWDFRTPAPPTPTVEPEGPIPSGGIPAKDWRPFEERDPYRFSQQVRQIIEEVAVSQVQHIELDEHQRFEQLTRELEAQEIEFEARHLQLLNQIREELIGNEIKDLLLKKDNEEAMLLILISAYLT